MARKLPIALTAVVLLAGLAADGYYLWLQQQAPGDILTVYGNVDIREVDLGFNVGRQIEKMRSEEGDAVSQGERLAALERERFTEQVAAARAKPGRQRALVRELETGSRPEKIEQVLSYLRRVWTD